MKLIIDTDENALTVIDEAEEQVLPLYSRSAFELISQLWLKVGWSQKYSYTFTWLGRPVIQLPEDMIRVQEVIYRVKPDVIVETGVAHGGSLVYYASLCKAMGKGRVIGVDIEIQPHNRKAIESHELSFLITLVEGDSVAPDVVDEVRSMIEPGEVVMVILDSCHTKRHVLAELEAYRHLVTSGSYLVATDGVMKDLYGVPGGDPKWIWDNPTAAAVEFAQRHPEFKLKQPAWQFSESELNMSVTHWPGGWLRKE